MIRIELLKQYGAVEKKLNKGEFLFQEEDKAVFYYQILSGSMKMNNYNENGQETIQGIFEAPRSFGEPAILGDFPYPANGEVIEKAHLICLEKSRFFQLLKEHPEIGIELLQVLSKRLRFKAMLSKEVKSYDAEHQILTLLHYLKENANGEGEYLVNMTRQTIANLTGLRVETVIRAVKKLKIEEKIIIRNRKIYI